MHKVIASVFRRDSGSDQGALDFCSKSAPDAANERIATGLKLFYETFPESRKQANRGGIIHESTPGRSEAREDISSIPSACD